MPGVLLKLLVKDKIPHSREVPVNAKEWQVNLLRRKITAPYEHYNQHERLAVETEEKDYSG